MGENLAPPGGKRTVNNGMHYQPQLVSRISEPSTVSPTKETKAYILGMVP